MIAQNFAYTRPKTLAEALDLLAGGEAKPLAGGMSLVPLMKLRLAAPERLVDLSRLAELNYIRADGAVVRIGAGTTHHQIESSDVVRSRCPLLAECAATIGDPQVRNRGTLGGSVAHADPASDYPAALLALDAQVVLTGPGGERSVPFEDFLVDTFTTALEPGEIVREVAVAVAAASEGHSYQKVAQPASGFAIVGIAARIRKESGRIAAARIGVTGLGPKAYRAAGVETELLGKPGTLEDAQRATAVIAGGVDANRDIHASADYRKHLARVHGMRAVIAALSRIA